jgi:hypothetical protein
MPWLYYQYFLFLQNIFIYIEKNIEFFYKKFATVSSSNFELKFANFFMFTKLKKQTLVITYGTLRLNSAILTLSLSFQKLLIYLTKVICCVCVCVSLSLSLFND